jgi:hypothetical protein
MIENAGAELPWFSLVDGGPFFRIVRRLHMATPRGMVRSWWLAFALWVPMTIGAALRTLAGMQQDPTVLDLSVHARVLVALPLMLLAERLIERAVGGAVLRLYKLCDRQALAPILTIGERLRDCWWVEALLLAIAIAAGQLVMWQLTGSTGLFRGGSPVGPWSFPRLWYGLVALPVTQFLLLRELWRWLIWSYMLVRIARLPLTIVPTHPDRAGGLSALAWPVSAFGGLVLAVGVTLSAAWANQLLAHRTTLPGLVPNLLGYMLGALAVAVWPLLLFCGPLFRARRQGLYDYNKLAYEYAQGFHTRWIGGATSGGEALGSPDIQSFNDLLGVFREVESTRWFVFGPREVIDVWAAAILPMLPLFATLVSVEVVLKRIASAVLGGLPL